MINCRRQEFLEVYPPITIKIKLLEQDLPFLATIRKMLFLCFLQFIYGYNTVIINIHFMECSLQHYYIFLFSGESH